MEPNELAFSNNKLPFFVLVQDHSTISPSISKVKESNFLNGSINSTFTSSGNNSKESQTIIDATKYTKSGDSASSNNTSIPKTLLNNATNIYPEIQYSFEDDNEEHDIYHQLVSELSDEDTLILLDFDKGGYKVKGVKSLSHNWQVTDVELDNLDEKVGTENTANINAHNLSKTKDITIKGTSSELYMDSESDLKPTDNLSNTKNLIELFRLRNYQLQKVLKLHKPGHEIDENH